MIQAQFEYRIDELRAGMREIKRTGGGSGRLGKGALGWVLFIVLAAILLWMLHRAPESESAPTQIPSPRLFDPVLSGILSAALLFVLLWIFAIIALRRSLIKKMHSFLGQIYTLEADPDLVTIGGATERTERRWSAFQKLVESKNLFLLFTAPKTAVILPKRIFDAASLDEFRQLAQTHITPPISGFPVIPLAERSQTQDQSQH